MTIFATAQDPPAPAEPVYGPVTGPAAEPGGAGFVDCRGVWHAWDEDE